MNALMIAAIIMMSGCYGRSYEMEELSKDVLKYKEGIEIDVSPIEKEKAKNRV